MDIRVRPDRALLNEPAGSFSVIAALRRGNLAASCAHVWARISEIPPFKPGAGSAANAGLTELLAESGLRPSALGGER